MAHELKNADENTVAVIQQHNLGELIQPLIREIHLFDSHVAGTTYLEDQSILETIKVGDTLILQREGTNEHDRHAILILNEEKKKLGYVPERDNLVFARLMDAGKILKAKITIITQKGSWTRIDVGIYLVDL
ncbi:MAG: HIRAN domain-containing protein [Thermoguttaceae bacterium]|nr:HIRAN domain-containing protein [Thermoguttaceae bacterium]